MTHHRRHERHGRRLCRDDPAATSRGMSRRHDPAATPPRAPNRRSDVRRLSHQSVHAARSFAESGDRTRGRRRAARSPRAHADRPADGSGRVRRGGARQRARLLRPMGAARRAASGVRRVARRQQGEQPAEGGAHLRPRRQGLQVRRHRQAARRSICRRSCSGTSITSSCSTASRRIACSSTIPRRDRAPSPTRNSTARIPASSSRSSRARSSSQAARRPIWSRRFAAA